MKIPLTKGKYALIDEQDEMIVRGRSWRYGFGGQGGEYAVSGGNKNDPTIRMHRLIMGAKKGEEVDHINGNGLDNRRSNLRIVTHHQNNMNKGIYKNNKLGMKGISKLKNGKYEALAYQDGTMIHLGSYKTIEEAQAARKGAEKILFGKYARKNKLYYGTQKDK